MNNTQKINLSPVLAQKKLLSGGNSNNGSSSLAAPSFNSGTKDTPSFFIPSERSSDNYGLPLSTIAATLARKAKSVYERYLASEDGSALLKKAAEYEIPFDIKTLDIIDLRDKVEEFENAIELASEYGIDWKEFGYDLIAIEQEVSEAQESEYNYISYARGEFNNSVLEA